MNMKSAKSEKESRMVAVDPINSICSTAHRFDPPFGERKLADAHANWTKRHRSTAVEGGA